MSAQKTYTEMPHGAGAGAISAQMGAGPCVGFQRATELGRETVQGRKVEKWRCEDPNIPYMTESATIWYDPALQFVIRQESGQGDRFELRNIEEGTQPAALFEIPAGYSKTNMPAMPAPGAAGGEAAFPFDPSQMEGLSDEEKAAMRKAMEKMMKQMEPSE